MLELSTQQKGTITELQVATYLMMLGYNVSQPFCQNSKYDLILDANNKLLRLQVKTAREARNKSIVFNCKSTTTNSKTHKSTPYTSEEIDYFATYWNDKAYLIPVDECMSQKQLCTNQPTSRKQFYIEDYSAEKILNI